MEITSLNNEKSKTKIASSFGTECGRLIRIVVLCFIGFLVLQLVVLPYGYIDIHGLPVINLNRFTVDECYDFLGDMAVTRAYAYAGKDREGGWSYIDKQGNPLTGIDSMWPAAFSDGLARVKAKELFGFVDKKGVYVIPPQFVEAGDFSEGLAAVLVDKKWGYIDRTGKVVIQPQFDLVHQFKEDRAGVKLGSKMGYVDKTGKVVIPATYSVVAPFCEGVGLAWGSEKLVYLDRNGRILHENKQSEPAVDVFSGYSSLMVQPYGGIIWNTPESFSDGLALTGVDGKYGYMDKSFKMVIPAQFDFAFRFSGERALVYDATTRRYGFIDRSGKQITGFKYERASDLGEDGLALVRESAAWNPLGLYGYIDKSGAYKIWPLFRQASPFSCGRARVGEYLQSS
jgi:hypothetical protein